MGVSHFSVSERAKAELYQSSVVDDSGLDVGVVDGLLHVGHEEYSALEKGCEKSIGVKVAVRGHFCGRQKIFKGFLKDFSTKKFFSKVVHLTKKMISILTLFRKKNFRFLSVSKVAPYSHLHPYGLDGSLKLSRNGV